MGYSEAQHFSEVAPEEELRNFYREAVCSFEDAEDVFKNIQERFGTIDFEKGMDFLFHTLSLDLSTDVPSMEKVHLEHVIGKLEKVRLLQSAFVIYSNVLERWDRVHEQKNCSLKPIDLLKNMLQLGKQRYLGATHVDDVVKKANPPNIELEVLFTQELFMAVRSTPPLLFEDSDAMPKVIDAFQASLDKAIKREDEYLASLE